MKISKCKECNGEDCYTMGLSLASYDVFSKKQLLTYAKTITTYFKPKKSKTSKKEKTK